MLADLTEWGLWWKTRHWCYMCLQVRFPVSLNWISGWWNQGWCTTSVNKKTLIVNQLICLDTDSTTQKIKHNVYTSGHKISLAFLYFVGSSFINHHLSGEKVPNDFMVFATFNEWNSQYVWTCSSCLQFNTKHYEDIFHVNVRKGWPII